MFCSRYPHMKDGFSAGDLVFSRLLEIRAIAEFLQDISMEDRDVRVTSLKLAQELSASPPAIIAGIAAMTEIPIADRVSGVPLEESLVDAMDVTPNLVVRLGYAIERIERIRTLYIPESDGPVIDLFLDEIALRCAAYPLNNEGTAARIAELFLGLANDIGRFVPKFAADALTIGKLQLYLSVHNHGSVLPLPFHEFPTGLPAESSRTIAEWILGNTQPALV